MKAKEFYNTAIYLRLSRDDEDIDGNKSETPSGCTSMPGSAPAKARACGRKVESNSISSQRDMIRSFIRKQANMEIYDIYVDDGFSGANFDRPAFKRMMEDVEAGKIDCVIVKDLSRLGRDYIEAGRLIQKTFPAFSVRFIALTDGFDSLTADYNETSLIVPVKNFINDSYSRDISTKVRSHQKMRRERGDYIGSFATFGYQKSRENKNLLVPEDYAASIVKRIFAWKIEGYSNQGISQLLEEQGVLSPLEYRKVRGEKCSTAFAKGAKAKWSPVAVKRILTNENYTGTLVQGRDGIVNYKVKKTVRKPEEEWVKVPNTHQAIVSREDFEIVQDLLKVETRPANGERKGHMYVGLLFCGDCGEPMCRRVSRYNGITKVSFICSTKNKVRGCTRHDIGEEDLNALVLAGLREQIALFLDKEKVIRSMEQLEIDFEEVAAFDKELERLHKEQDKYLSLRADLYEDLKRKIITEDDFKSFRKIYEKRYQELQQAVVSQEETIKKLFRSGVQAGMNLERMKNVMQITKLDRTTLVTFVKRILVYEDHRVYLELRHKELFSKVVMLADFIETKGRTTEREVV